MSEDYLFECQRAELLGQIPPTEEEWRKKFLTNVDDSDKNEDNNADAEVKKKEKKKKLNNNNNSCNIFLRIWSKVTKV